MPRPNLSARGSGASRGGKPSNPFQNWLAKRKERRLETEEEAARLITNSIVKNQNTIIDKLNSTDFLHSRLPKSVLEYKTNPDQGCCDLEYAAKTVVRMLLNDPQIIKMDIRKFDEKLLTLVLLFKQAVEQGDKQAAYAAKAALIRAVKDIRSRIPQNQPELAKQFVEKNANYLEQWITLVTLAQVADRMGQNVETMQSLHNKELKQDADATAELRKRLTDPDEPEYAIAFQALMEPSMQLDRSKWTPMHHEVHRMMVERRMEKANVEISGMQLHQNLLELTIKQEQIDTLFFKVANLPIVTDLDLMTKYQQGIDELFRDLAESDAQIDEALKMMDDVEGRIQQLNLAPGSVRAREVAAEEAEKALEELRDMENKISGKTAQNARRFREQAGLHTDEELQAMQAQQMQQLYEQMEDQQEQTLLAN